MNWVTRERPKVDRVARPGSDRGRVRHGLRRRSPATRGQDADVRRALRVVQGAGGGDRRDVLRQALVRLPDPALIAEPEARAKYYAAGVPSLKLQRHVLGPRWSQGAGNQVHDCSRCGPRRLSYSNSTHDASRARIAAQSELPSSHEVASTAGDLPSHRQPVRVERVWSNVESDVRSAASTAADARIPSRKRRGGRAGRVPLCAAGTIIDHSSTSKIHVGRIARREPRPHPVRPARQSHLPPRARERLGLALDRPRLRRVRERHRQGRGEGHRARGDFGRTGTGRGWEGRSRHDPGRDGEAPRRDTRGARSGSS